MTYARSMRPELADFIPKSCRKLLDVGCFMGDVGAYLRTHRGIEVWGVEPNSSAARVAERQLDRVINGYFSADSPIPDESFDVVLFADSLEHFPETGPALQLARKKLRPGGRIVCSLPNVRFIDNLEHLLLHGDWRYEDSGIRDRTHLRFFTSKSARRTFEEEGFKVVELVGINEDWWRKDRVVRRIVFRLFPRLTEDMRYLQYLIVAEPA